jgi:hypothetical protein
MSAPHTFVIDFGDLPGLTVLAIQHDHPGVVLWHPQVAAPNAPALERAVERQAAVLGVADLVVRPAPDADEPRELIDGVGTATTAMVLEAARRAFSVGARRLVWPVHCGVDHDAIARVMERVQLITHLIELDIEGEPLHIETPFVDLTDRQIGEIALHADAPVSTAWYCDYDRPEPCGGCDRCLRWRPVADSATPPGLAVGPEVR